ncbi:phosphate signaling complex protein PhoU [Peptococcus simiae]|uniref:Phosphate-specific transport system accessory protein PhoU n=1 Tax=Peptococcus simiae TaxID=1643805 RepID=A0ABW9H2U9_9FIRM
MRERLDNEIMALNSEMVRMVSFAEDAIHMATQSLAAQVPDVVERAVEANDEVERLDQTIERRCLNVLLKEQPVAGDLRLVSSVLKMITDVNRIGDQAANIAEMTLRHPDICGSEDSNPLRQMGDVTERMLADVINAFVGSDLEMAKEVIASDDVVDRIYRDLQTDLVVKIKNETDDIETAIQVILIAKYYERIGDHIVNMAHWVDYTITGELNR